MGSHGGVQGLGTVRPRATQAVLPFLLPPAVWPAAGFLSRHRQQHCRETPGGPSKPSAQPASPWEAAALADFMGGKTLHCLPCQPAFPPEALVSLLSFMPPSPHRCT